MGNVTRAAPWSTVSGLPWAGVNYFCTTRQGGVSGDPWSSLNVGLHTDDDSGHVRENRRLLRARLPGEPLWLNQVHGALVADADQFAVPQPGCAATPITADAAVTVQSNRVLAIMTADCLPVILASADGRALGVAHAGWRGLAAGVLEQTLSALRAKAPYSAHWRAWIGPGISQRHFEVGADVFAAFAGRDEQAAIFFAEKIPGCKWLADLPGLARHRLHKAGVGNIELSGYCTFSQAEMFYSYRRNVRTGRLVTVAWLGENQRSDLP